MQEIIARLKPWMSDDFSEIDVDQPCTIQD